MFEQTSHNGFEAKLAKRISLRLLCRFRLKYQNVLFWECLLLYGKTAWDNIAGFCFKFLVGRNFPVIFIFLN